MHVFRPYDDRDVAPTEKTGKRKGMDNLYGHIEAGAARIKIENHGVKAGMPYDFIGIPDERTGIIFVFPHIGRPYDHLDPRRGDAAILVLTPILSWMAWSLTGLSPLKNIPLFSNMELS